VVDHKQMNVGVALRGITGYGVGFRRFHRLGLLPLQLLAKRHHQLGKAKDLLLAEIGLLQKSVLYLLGQIRAFGEAEKPHRARQLVGLPPGVVPQVIVQSALQ
jgi:hypothetical protein